MNLEIEDKLKQQLNNLKKAIGLKRGPELLIAQFNHYHYRDSLLFSLRKQFKESDQIDLGKKNQKDTKDKKSKRKTKTINTFQDFASRLDELKQKYSTIHLVNNSKIHFKDVLPDFFKNLESHLVKLFGKGERKLTLVLWMKKEDVKFFSELAPKILPRQEEIFTFNLPEERYMPPTPSPFQWLSEEEISERQQRMDDILCVLAKEKGDIAKAYYNMELGHLNYALAAYAEAEKYAFESLQYFERIGYLFEMHNVFKLLKAIYWDIGDNVNARYMEGRRLHLESILKGAGEYGEGPHQILVVEDEKDWEDLVTLEFEYEIENKGWELIFAEDGYAALEEVQKYPELSVILLDIKMPNMDGLEFLKRLSAMDRPEVIVIMVTAYGDLKNIQAAMKNRAFSIIPKPVDFSSLKNKIEEALVEAVTWKKANQLSQKERESALLTQKFRKEREEVAQTLLCMMPNKLPVDDKIDIELLYQPAEEDNPGDFFDCFRIDSDSLVLLVGDVSPKGLNAVWAATKDLSLFKAIGRLIVSPFRCLELVNEILLSARGLMYETLSVFLGKLNTQNGQFEYSMGGDPSLYVLKNTGGVCKKKKEKLYGLPLGSKKDAQYLSHKIFLNDGDTVLICTDGVEDLRNKKGEQFKDNVKLEEYLKGKQHLSLENIISELNELIKNYAEGTDQFDDITILGLRYKKKGTG